MPSVLIVDDCPEIAAILARHLSRAGYRPTLAHDGAAALATLARIPAPDCLVLDLMLPGLSGVELLYRLRKDRATAEMPVVLVSSRVGEGRTHIFAEGDADYCVGKPFTHAQVVAAVNAAVRARATRAPAQLAARLPHP